MKKYKLLTLLLFIVVSLTFIGCSKNNFIAIDWIDFVKWNDISYENANTLVPNEYIGNELGEVSKIAPTEVTGTKPPKSENGEAAFLNIGTKLFEIKGYNSESHIAVLTQNQYYLYKTHDSNGLSFTQSSPYKELSTLPNEYTPELARANGDVVNVLGNISNIENFDDFLESFNNRNDDMIRLTGYTDEGDAIISDMIISNGNTKLFIDSTRDKFSSPDDRKITEYTVADILKQTRDNNIEYIAKLINGEEIFLISVENQLASSDMPFKDLKATEVEKISLYVGLPEKTLEIKDAEDIKEVVEILNKVVTYEEDPSNTQYYGQLVQYTLTLKSGATLNIGAFNPFILINQVSYKTKYEPCEELNALGNRLLNEN
ncbi:MAG: DUF4362 domain-containing protein [Clostridium sp.]|uniref:DUF4362 domain-containing protein n=1 Tax=Clostridium sp. TaxID=1506 RepID=UPI0032171DA2